MNTVNHDITSNDQEDDFEARLELYSKNREHVNNMYHTIKVNLKEPQYAAYQIPKLTRILEQLCDDSRQPMLFTENTSVEKQEFAERHETILTALYDEVLNGKKIDIQLYKIGKIQDKVDRPVNIGLLTPGTVFEYNLPGRDSLIKTATVKMLQCNGYKSWVVETVEEAADPCYNDEIRPMTFNAQWITRVIKHVPGHLLTSKDMPMSSAYYLLDPVRRDGKYYSASSSSCLVNALIGQMDLKIDLDEQVNIERLTAFLWEQGVIKDVESDEWYSVFVAQKKRLRKLIRQNINRFKIPQSKLLEDDLEEQKSQSENYYADLDN